MTILQEIEYFNTHIRSGYMVCTCVDWQESDGEGLQGSCRHTDALDAIVYPDSNMYRLYTRPAQAHG